MKCCTNKAIFSAFTYTDCYIYIVPPDDEQQACSKHVQVNR